MAYRALAEHDPSLQYLADITESIRASGVADLLAGRVATHVHDLCVTSMPISEPPVEVIVVRTPDSLWHRARPGRVVVEHLTNSGRDDKIERSSDEAVPLFWRFCLEKFGVVRSK